MSKKRILASLAACAILAFSLGTSTATAQTGSLAFGQPAYGYPGQTGIRIPVIYTSDVGLCGFEFVMDLEESILTFADPPVDTVGTVCGEVGPMDYWAPWVCDADSQWFVLACVPTYICDRTIPAEETIILNLSPGTGKTYGRHPAFIPMIAEFMPFAP